jgi:hypothetical protein
MTLFHAPSPSGRNAAKLYLNEAGHLFDGRTGSYWGRSGIVRMREMAMDQEPGHGEVAEALLAMRSAIEECIGESQLDLHPEAKAAILECLDRHVKPSQHQKRGMGPGYYKHGATDDTVEERAALRCVAGENGHDKGAPDLEEFVKFLRQRGLDEEAIREAIEIVQGSGDVEDRFPTSGPLSMGGRMSENFREYGHEPAFRGRHAPGSNDPHHGALDNQHRLDALDAVARINKNIVAGPAPAGAAHLTKRERKKLAADARAASSGLHSRFGETFDANVNRILNGRLGRV